MPKPPNTLSRRAEERRRTAALEEPSASAAPAAAAAAAPAAPQQPEQPPAEQEGRGRPRARSPVPLDARRRPASPVGAAALPYPPELERFAPLQAQALGVVANFKSLPVDRLYSCLRLTADAADPAQPQQQPRCAIRAWAPARVARTQRQCGRSLVR